MKKTIYILTVLIMIVALLLSGCGKSASATLSTSEILSKSYDAMQAVNSFHFILGHTGGSTPISMGVEMTGAEGDTVKPDKLQVTISGTAAGLSIEVKMVTVGDKTDMTNPLTGKWETLSDQFKVLGVFDPGTGIASIVKDMTAPSVLADEQVGDILCYHLKGGIASESLSSITGSAIAGVVVDTEVWIGKDDFLVRQAKLTGKITASEADGIVRTLTFTNFNQTVDITLPK